MTDKVITKLYGRTFTIKLNHAENRNALTEDMYDALIQALEEADEKPGIRCVIITAEGDWFTSGNDIADMADKKSGKKLPGIQFLEALRDLRTPVIVAVNGNAAGVGLTMLLLADLAFASEKATFSAPFAQVGLVPTGGSSMLLPLFVGNAWATDILLGGRVLTAAEALDIGLVSRVTDNAALSSVAEEVAARICSFAPTAIKKTKRLLRTNRSLIAVRMNQETKMFTEQLSSVEFKEAVKAEKDDRLPMYG